MVGRQFYSVMVVVSVNIFHFQAWADQVVPVDYARTAHGRHIKCFG